MKSKGKRFTPLAVFMLFATLFTVLVVSVSAETADIVTEYGTIPASSITSDVNVAIFAKGANDTEYTFVETGSSFVDNGLDIATALLKKDSGSYAGGTAVVYLINDYSVNGAGWKSAIQVDGTLVIDLGGNTLTSTAPKLIGFESSAGYTSESSIEIKNGMLSTQEPIVELFGDIENYGDETKVCNFKANTVTFNCGAVTANDMYMFKVRDTVSTTRKANLNVELIDCILDYQNQNKVVVLNNSAPDNTVYCDITVRGGNIAVGSIDNFVLLNGTSSEDSVILSKNESGIRTQFTLNYTENAPKNTFPTDNGNMHLASETVNKTTIVYSLSDVNTPYGYIPENQADKIFSVYYNDLHLGSESTYYKAIDLVRKSSTSNAIFYGKSLTVYMSKSYEHTDKAYANFAQILGTFTLDLGGNVLTQTSNYIFDAAGKAVGALLDPTNVNVKNGTILTNDKPIININSKGTTGNFGYTGVKKFNFTFESVKFDKNSSTSSYNPLIAVDRFDVVDTEAGSKNVYLSALFTDCSFKSENSLLFDLSSCNYVDADIKIEGGMLTTSDMSTYAIMSCSDADDRLTFLKTDEGKYMTLNMPKNSQAPKVTFNNGTLEFVKVSEDSDTASFALTDANLSSYIPKMSITLDSSLIMNVYVPVQRTESFTFDGVSFENLSKTVVTLDDGEEYYRVTAELTASEAARSVVLSAVVATGDSSVTGTFTFSVLKYASKILDSTDSYGIEKELMKDILSYIRAAYAYFDKSDAEQMAKIDALLGENYDSSNAPELNGNAIAPSKGLKSVTYILNATPTIRFHITGNADSYTFYADGVKLKTVVGTDKDGTYIDMDVYAYAMCKTITYNIDGVESGSYHINSYYTFVTTDEEYKDNSELINLVARFAKYCESAAAYREYYLFNHCEHDYEESVALAPSTFTDGQMIHICKECGDSYNTIIPATKSLKILSIGNSFSQDAMAHLYIVAKDAGIETLVLGNLIKGGCSLYTHLSCMTNDTAAYEFYISSAEQAGMKRISTEATAKFALEYEDWDFITLQQSSPNSGLPDTYSYLDGVIDYVNAHKTNSEAKLIWHMTWAYQNDSTHTSFPTYDSNQLTMYNAILSTVAEKILIRDDIHAVIPSGTAIQNLRTSHLGDTLTRDGYHMSLGIGRYTAALTYLAAITGYDINEINATPSAYPEVAEHLACIKEAVTAAIASPYSITPSTYKPEEKLLNTTLSALTDEDRTFLSENGYDPDCYMLLDLEILENAYYNSTRTLWNEPLITTDTSSSFYYKYLCTQVFSRAELITGTLIRIDSGYKYRPDAWVSSSSTASDKRPAETTSNITVVDSAWWGDFEYRAFNIASRTTTAKVYAEDASAFKIYVPVAKQTDLTDEDRSYLSSLGLNADEYKVIDFEYMLSAFYYCSANASNVTSNNEAFTAKFFCTEILSRYDITLGSIIRLSSNEYKYRPEGWTDLDINTTSRPDATDAEFVTVDAAWWGEFLYRAFNVSRNDGTPATDSDVAAFRIYVKIAK